MEELGFEPIFTNEFASGYLNPEKGVVALAAKADYIPITKFKQLFEMISDEVKAEDGVYKLFIFDKSVLRTFHQPSMKWYFMEWKTEMLNYGLKTHVKILPKINYFVKAVEAARKPLLAKFPPEILNKINILYTDTIEEALAIKPDND